MLTSNKVESRRPVRINIYCGRLGECLDLPPRGMSYSSLELPLPLQVALWARASTLHASTVASRNRLGRRNRHHGMGPLPSVIIPGRSRFC
jgi:hypothetical protein